MWTQTAIFGGQMVRFPDWDVRLQAYIFAVQDAVFEHGALDCALFVAGAVNVMTGVDLAKGLRGYKTEAEGLARVRAKGFKDHVDVFAKSLPVATRLQVGDVAVLEEGDRRAVGIVFGPRIYVMRHRLAVTRLDHAVGGFSV